MIEDRRTFLKTSAGIVLAAGALPAAAQTAATPVAARAATQPALARMTYATIRSADGSWGLGVRTDKGVLDVRATSPGAAPVSTDALIRGEGDLARLAALVDEARAGGAAAKHLVPENAVQFGPAVTRPPKILCIGLNYRAHVQEAGEKLPTTPIFFNKFTSSLNGHGGTIAVSKEHAKDFDYEAELVVVMGKGGRDIPESAALDHVFGYTVGLDFSARDLQMATSQWMMGKAGDGWGPVGPWLVSADGVDPQKLDIGCKVNGEVRQASNTSLMIFSVAQQIAFLSRNMALEAGDIIFTGTPDGVIIGYPKDKQVWLKAGDVVTTSIQGLGEQTVTLV